jgi:hypothetical protein
VTPLNFVCKCRAAPPPRQRPTASGEISIEQTFGRAQFCAFFCSCDRNTDELRVFITRRRLFFRRACARRRPSSIRFRSREGVRRNGFTKPKFFYGKPAEKALRPALEGAKRTNRRQAIRSGGTREAVRALAWHPRRGDFRRRSRPRAPRATEFSHARTPEAAALRFRDVA